MAQARFSRFNCSPGCPVEATVTLIDGKWKCVILYHLLTGTLRFNQLRRLIPCATQRVLTAQLRELEADELVQRTVYPEVPPRVEYQLSPLGQSLRPVIEALGVWGAKHLSMFKTAEQDVRSSSSSKAVTKTETI